MLAAGVPLEIASKQLGHSSIGITADTYSHLLKGVGRAAAEAASALVPRKQRDQAVTKTGVTAESGTPGKGRTAGQRVPPAGFEPATIGLEAPRLSTFIPSSEASLVQSVPDCPFLAGSQCQRVSGWDDLVQSRPWTVPGPCMAIITLRRLVQLLPPP